MNTHTNVPKRGIKSVVLGYYKFVRMGLIMKADGVSFKSNLKVMFNILEVLV